MNRFATQVAHVAPPTLFVLMGLALFTGRATAKPLTEAFVVTDTDWTSAAVGGIGGGNRHGGTGTIALSGVNGSVKQAILYWHGIDNFTPRPAKVGLAAGSWAGGRNKDAVGESPPPHLASCDGFYNVPTIALNGISVTGDPLGDSETNCWGVGTSRAFRADVTSIVTGNGLYTLSDMTADECDDANGASLIVMFTDGNPANNRDLVFFDGNDANLFFGFPGEDDGWHATLPGITFTSGTATLQIHVADGQDLTGNGLDDDALTIAADGQSVVIPDISGRYDGTSVANAGFSRSEAVGKPGSLWDVHTFDIRPIFTAPGTYTLTLDGLEQLAGDCTGLVLAIVDLQAGATQLSTHAASWSQVKTLYR